MKLQIFISHSSKDRQAVEGIRRQLEAMNVTPWMFEYDVRPGEYVAHKVEGELDKSAAVVVLLTKAGAASPSVHQEVGYARGKGILVIPLVERGVTAHDLGLLNGLEYVAFDSAAPQDALTQLTSRVHKLVEAQRIPVVAPEDVDNDRIIRAAGPVTFTAGGVSSQRQPAVSEQDLAIVALVGVILIIAVLSSKS